MAAPAHPDLHTCLETASWRRLLAIMASHGLPCSTRWRKADLVQALHAHLSQADTLAQIITNLGQPAQDALVALLRAGGMLPARPFTATFGTIRPHRPWRKESQPDQPWSNPASPAERLWYLGLLHLHPPRPAPGVSQHMIIPADLLAPLQHRLLAPQTALPIHLHPRPGHPPDLAWHVALLLATLEADPVRLVKGGWLPPRILAALANRTGLDQAVDFQPSRSERRMPYLAFLHYLSQAAGLIAGHHLRLTTLGWQWLAAAPHQRWQTLWQAWLAATSDLASPFRFPWADLTPPARTLVLAQVQQLPMDGFTPLAQVVEQVHVTDEHQRLVQPWNQAEDVAAALISGPLLWFGIVDLGEGRDERLSAGTPAPSLRLTRLGAWLLKLPDWGPPPFPSTQPCTIRPVNRNLVLIPPLAKPTHLAHLAPFCQWLPPQFPALEQRLLLSEERVGQAVARGTPLAQILYHLQEALGQPPSRRQQQRLRLWAQAGQQVRVRHLTVLETSDPQLMGRLRSRRLIRRHLGDALSPTRSMLNPAGLPALLHTLRALGLYAAAPPSPEPAESSPSQSSLSQADASRVYLAGLVYQALGAHVPLLVPLSAEIMADLAGQLTPAQREAAEHTAAQVLEQLRAALQGYLALPAWQAPGTPEDVLPTLEEAMAGGQDLILTYWGAGREQASVRRVTPYWLERRANTLYLIAYCHLREAERVFRVDRIVTARPIHTQESPDSVVKVP
jgi:hypothetical protein